MKTENKNLLTVQNICGVIMVADETLQQTNTLEQNPS
jgi:hypothetical protein